MKYKIFLILISIVYLLCCVNRADKNPPGGETDSTRVVSTEAWEGTYRLVTGKERKITVRERDIYYEVPPLLTGSKWKKFKLMPLSENIFVAEDKQVYTIFRFDSLELLTTLLISESNGDSIILIKTD